MKRISTLILAFSAVDAAATAHLSAQIPERVSGEVSCAECFITFDTVLTIGGLDGPGMHVVSPFSHVAVDRRGRILVAAADQAEISVFDSSGRFLRTVGRRGEGPGEYGSISHIAVGPRYIHIFDPRDGQTILDHDFRVVRTDPFPGQIGSAFVVGDGSVVFAGDEPTSAAIGHNLHMISGSGEIVSYDHDGEPYPSPLTGSTSRRSFVAGAGDALWEVGVVDNRLVRWDLVPEPRVARVIERQVVEFDRAAPPYVVENFPGSGRSGRNVGAMLDDEGLWIIWHTPDPEWTGSLSAGDILSLVVKLSDGWLDLVDPDTGRTIGRHHQDGIFLGFAGGSGYAVAYHETDAGVPFIHLLEPRLSRR